MPLTREIHFRLFLLLRTEYVSLLHVTKTPVSCASRVSGNLGWLQGSMSECTTLDERARASSGFIPIFLVSNTLITYLHKYSLFLDYEAHKVTRS